MKKEVKTYKLADLELNTGQLGWLPRNPRQWMRQDLDAMAASIKEDPDFIQDRPPLVVPSPKHKGKAVVFAHNLWTSAAQDGSLVEEVTCYVYTPEGDADRDTIVRRALKDNGTFGSWDWDILANEWPTEQAAAWGVPVWNTPNAPAEGAAPDSDDDDEGGAEEVNFEGAFAYAVRVNCKSLQEQLDLVKELRRRGFEVAEL